MTRHFAKVLDMIWYLSMGLFLGLTAGLVLAVILTFRGARAIDATPGVEPFSDPRFAAYHNDAVAGYIGQDLFRVGGTVALVLLGVALIVRAISSRQIYKSRERVVGSKRFSRLRRYLLVSCVLLMVLTARLTYQMNQSWPSLYDLNASEEVLVRLRLQFEDRHQWSERYTSVAWFCGMIALIISPWCRRIADTPVKEAEAAQE